MQFIPQDLAWLQPVIVMTGVVFVIGLIGNILSFSSRFMNALVTAIVFALIAAALFYSVLGGSIPKTIAAPADLAWLEPVIVMSAVIFVIDLVANMLSFSNRVVNALVTAVLFGLVNAVLFATLYKEALNGPAAGQVPAAITAPATPAPAPAP
jgi:hypothetical protein